VEIREIRGKLGTARMTCSVAASPRVYPSPAAELRSADSRWRLSPHLEGYNLAREIVHRRGEKPNGCARNRLSRMIGVHE
jgi:hypothetical protein